MRFTLFSLATAAFAIGTTEFAPMGLLPVIATGLGVSIPTAGLLVSAYALGVMLGAPLMTLVLGRVRRKTALQILMVIFTVGNLLSAVAPGYTTLLLARVVTSLAHGAFFGLGALVAAELVPKERRGSAVATMFMGLTIANIGGVPAATWIGQAIGWRAAFGATAGLGLLALISLAIALPAGKAGDLPDLGREIKVLTRPVVLRALLTTTLSSGAMFSLYTYIAAIIAHVTHGTAGFVTAMLVVCGVGFTIGNAVSGKMADRSVRGTLLFFFALMAVVMLSFPLYTGSQAGMTLGLLVWAAAAFAVVSPLQMRVMQAAGEAPGLASSVNIGAFNLGNALGAAVGGAVLATGLGYEWIVPAGGLLGLLALLTVLKSEAGAEVAAAPVAN